MKKAIICAALLMSMGCAVTKPAPERVFTVHHINRGDTTNELIVKRSYQWWQGICKTIPDTLKRGDKMVAVLSKTTDSCNCYFKRIKK